MKYESDCIGKAELNGIKIWIELVKVGLIG